MKTLKVKNHYFSQAFPVLKLDGFLASYEGMQLEPIYLEYSATNNLNRMKQFISILNKFKMLAGYEWAISKTDNGTYHLHLIVNKSRTLALYNAISHAGKCDGILISYCKRMKRKGW
jgi:hypothetical protein